MMVLTVPFMTTAAIEREATALLVRYATYAGVVPRPPIPIENIVEGLLEVSFEVGDLRGTLGMDDVLGATWLDDRFMMLDSSIEEHAGRYSFTLAHEAGHWHLHRPYIEMEKVTVPLFPRALGDKPRAAIVCRSGEKKLRQEVQADAFAAAVLMPASDVRAAAREALGDRPLAIEGLNVRRGMRAFDPELKEAAAVVMEAGNFTNVSNEAMRVRLVELKVVVDGAQQVLL